MKLRHLAEFEDQFGKERLMISGASPEDPRDAMPTMAEMGVLLWMMTSQKADKCPWKSQDDMMASVDASEIMGCYDDIMSFFLGVDVSGMKVLSDSSDSDSAPKTGQN